ncbi:hypothetical protein ACLKA6_003200 [Drosophila palustris]
MTKFPSFVEKGLGRTNWLTHEIDVGEAQPIKQRHYAVSPAVEKLMYKYREIKASVELDNYVYRRSEHASGDVVADDLCWKLWIPVSMVPEVVKHTTTTTTGITAQRSATSRNTLVCVCESTVRQPGSNDNSNQATAQRSATSCNTFECVSTAVVPVSPVECIHGHQPAAAKTTREVCVPRGSSGTLSTSSGPSPVYQAWEHQSPVRGPSYRHTDSLPTDPTWRPDLRGVEGILGRRDIVIRFLLSGLHPLAPPGRSELAPKIWRRKARGERRNGSRESLLVLLDQSWVRSQVIRADFSGGNFSLSADALAALSSRPR